MLYSTPQTVLASEAALDCGQGHDVGISALADDPGVGVEAGDGDRDA